MRLTLAGSWPQPAAGHLAAAAAAALSATVTTMTASSSQTVPGDQWLLRLAPAAAFSIQQAIPNYPQVSNNRCSAALGCYPLAPWTGFAVLCVWAAAALALALFLLRRRDA